MEDTNKPIFIDGYITRDILDTQPLWLLGTGAIHAKKMIAFLQANEKYADKGGWIPFKTVRSKSTGSRYSQIDMWQVNNSVEGAKPSTEPKYQMPTDKEDEQFDKDFDAQMERELNDKDAINQETASHIFNKPLTQEELDGLQDIPF